MVAVSSVHILACTFVHTCIHTAALSFGNHQDTRLAIPARPDILVPALLTAQLIEPLLANSKDPGRYLTALLAYRMLLLLYLRSTIC